MNKITREQAKEAFQILLNLNHEMLEVSSAWETVGVFFSQTCESCAHYADCGKCEWEPKEKENQP